jgi:peptide/nickel transport system substrate-binding protein
MNRFMRLLLVMMVITTMLLSGCGGGPTATPVPPKPAEPTKAPVAVEPTKAPAAQPTAAAAQPKKGGSIVVGLHQEPDRLWGPITGLTVAQEVAGLLNEALIGIDDKLAYIPMLASEVPTMQNGGISADGLTFTFKLRKDVKWQDGTPFTSKDVKFTYDMLVNPDVPARGRVGWDQIDKVTMADDWTIAFHFSRIDAPFLDRVAIVTMLPFHILGKVAPKDVANNDWFKTNKPGLGPFKFVEWKPGNYISVERNPDYYKGPALLDKIVIKIVTDANTLTNQLDTGEVDIRFRMLSDQVPAVQKLSNVRIQSTTSTTPWLIWLNNLDPRLSEQSVRLALNYGFDRKALTGTVLKGLLQPAYDLIPPTSWAYDDASVLKYEFDQAKAKKLLDDAGWKPGADGIREKGGLKLSFDLLNIAGEQERVQILSFVQAQWKDIGVNMNLKNVDVATMWGNALPKGTYDMAYSYSGRYADPADITQHFLCPDKKPTTNWGRYCNAKLDDVLIAAQSTLDQAKRKELYKQALKMTTEDPAYVFIAWRGDHTPINKRLQGYKPATGYLEMWNAAEWWVTN